MSWAQDPEVKRELEALSEDLGVDLQELAGDLGFDFQELAGDLGFDFQELADRRAGAGWTQKEFIAWLRRISAEAYDKAVERALDRATRFYEAMRAALAREPMPDGSDPLDHFLEFPGVELKPLRFMTYADYLAIEKWFKGVNELGMAPFN